MCKKFQKKIEFFNKIQIKYEFLTVKNIKIYNSKCFWE